MNDPKKITAILEGTGFEFLSGWRHYIFLNANGVVVGSAVGEGHSMRQTYSQRAAAFYRAGTWESGFDASGRPTIKPEIISRAANTQQTQLNYDQRIKAEIPASI